MRIDGIINYLRRCAEDGKAPQVSATDARVIVKRFDAMAKALSMMPDPTTLDILADTAVRWLDEKPGTMGYRAACREVLAEVVREWLRTSLEEKQNA